MIEATDATFEDTINTEGVVLVKFGAEWCQPCKVLIPTLSELETQYADTVKFASVDIDTTNIAQRFAIRGVPTLLIFKGGTVINTLVGTQTKGRLQLAIDTALA